jgi:uncharacterized protein (DUF433 family)
MLIPAMGLVVPWQAKQYCSKMGGVFGATGCGACVGGTAGLAELVGAPWMWPRAAVKARAQTPTMAVAARYLGKLKRCSSWTLQEKAGPYFIWMRDQSPAGMGGYGWNLCGRRQRLRDNEEVTAAITRNAEIMHGAPVFRGTRVPVQTLFDYLEGGDTLADLLDGFPTVSRDLALQALEEAKTLLLAHC